MLFFLPLQHIILRIAEKKRIQALSKSYVKIKGTDVLATTKIFYGLVAVPIFLAIYNVLTFLIFYFKVGLRFGLAVEWTSIFAIFFPIYLYIGIVEFDDLKINLRVAWLRLRFFSWNKQEHVRMLEECAKIKFELEKEILQSIKLYAKSHLRDELKEPILNRRLSQAEAEEAKFNEIVRAIGK